MNDFIHAMKKEKKSAQALATTLKSEIDTFPKGSLRCRTRANRVSFYHRFHEKDLDGGDTYECRYLRQEDHMIRRLARKQVIKAYYPTLLHNITLLAHCIEHWDNQTLDDLIADLPAPIVRQFEEAAIIVYGEQDTEALLLFSGRDAANGNLAGPSPNYPEHLIHNTIKGEKVRSKSEALIANLLYAHKVPYQYEAMLLLDNQRYWPDFTILRPSDKKIIYWEHFGLMGDEEYAERAERKLAVYRAHGILPCVNLLTSYESPEGAIDTQAIERIIQGFLL